MLRFTYISIIFVLFLVNSCTYTLKIKDGETAYQQKQYAVAVPMLQKAFNKEKKARQKAKWAYLLGQSYDKMNQAEKALEWYQKAYNEEYGEQATHAYAFALKNNGKYTDAIRIFKELNTTAKNNYNYQKQIIACQKATLWLEEEMNNPYSITETTFNSAQADYAPTWYQNGKIIISSDRTQGKKDKKFKWTGHSFSNLYLIDTLDNHIELFDSSINSPYNEGTIAFRKNYTQAIFSRCGENNSKDNYCQLYITNKQGNTWTTPKILPFIQYGVNYAHPTWSPDEKTLYFAADYKDGWGGYDIYKIHHSNSGWGEPQILSAVINTHFDEMFPTWHQDTFYFASEGHGGMGGLDIFKSQQNSSNQWLKPINLKAPINSPADDFHLIAQQITKDSIAQKGYFSSSRNGNDDIFAFQKKNIPRPPTPVIPISTDTLPIAISTPIQEVKKEIFLEITVLGKTYSNPSDPKSVLLEKTPIHQANLQYFLNGKTTTIQTDAQGKYKLKIKKNIDYRFFASSPHYYNQSTLFNTVHSPDKSVYELEIVLDKIFRNVEINLKNIYYDYNKWDIRADAQPTLNALAHRLLENPSIKIVLGSHTDCRGNKNYNQKLSQKRAEAAVDYLVNQGVERSRLQATGYGESAPITNCSCKNCSEEEHQTNRRTTFLIKNF